METGQLYVVLLIYDLFETTKITEMLSAKDSPDIRRSNHRQNNKLPPFKTQNGITEC